APRSHVDTAGAGEQRLLDRILDFGPYHQDVVGDRWCLRPLAEAVPVRAVRGVRLLVLVGELDFDDTWFPLSGIGSLMGESEDEVVEKTLPEAILVGLGRLLAGEPIRGIEDWRDETAGGKVCDGVHPVPAPWCVGLAFAGMLPRRREQLAQVRLIILDG